jgi:hypothetical protein
MHNKLGITVACIAIVCCSPGYGQSRDIALTVTDGDTIATIHLGLDPVATDTIDAALGEVELPPVPPAGAFDARFIGTDIGIGLKQGVVKDYRIGMASSVGVRVHELLYQPGEGTTITIGWNLPADVTARLQDFATGALVNVSMAGTGSFVVTNPGIYNKLKLTVHYKPVHVRLNVFLQGPFNTGTGAMATTLNTAGHLTTHFGAGTYPATSVDSINIEIRDSASASKSTIRRYGPAWLLLDGTLRNFSDTALTHVAWDSVAEGSYYIVVRHRNHLAIMSANGVVLSTTGTEYDFTTSQSSAYGIDAMKGFGTGNTAPCALYGADANADGQITSTDFNVFNPKFTSGATGYQASDWNLDAQVTSTDFNLFNPNFTTGKATRVP